MPVVFTDEVEALPASGAVDKMHIIDVDHFIQNVLEEEWYYEEPDHGETDDNSGDIKIWDSVATVLFKRSPEVLARFLDPNTSSFKFTMNPKPNSSMMNRIIWRKGNELMVGTFSPVNYHGDALYEWDNLIRCESDSSGGWKIVTASFGGYSKAVMEDAWYDGAQKVSFSHFMKPQDASGKQEFANILGTGMLVNRAWEIEQWDVEVKDKGDAAKSTQASTEK